MKTDSITNAWLGMGQLLCYHEKAIRYCSSGIGSIFGCLLLLRKVLLDSLGDVVSPFQVAYIDRKLSCLIPL